MLCGVTLMKDVVLFSSLSLNQHFALEKPRGATRNNLDHESLVFLYFLLWTLVTKCRKRPTQHHYRRLAFLFITTKGSQRKESCVGSGAQSKFLKGIRQTTDLKTDFIILKQPNPYKT